jgi:outer membrane receptor protein involved in Fe transport
LSSWDQAIGLLNANVDYTIPNHGLTLSVFATNLLDKQYQLQSLSLPFAYTGQTQEPRIWGVSVRKTFGDE